MARTTVSETLQRIRRQLSASHRQESDTLLTSVNSSTTTIVLSNTAPAGLRRGSVISIGLESMRLTANASGATCTVLRGFMDSDAASHTAGDEVWINPEYQPIDIFDAMQDEIGSWGPNLYRVVGATFTTADGDSVLDLGATYLDAYGLIDVRRNRDSLIIGEPILTWPRANVRFQRGTATGWTGQSGMLLRFIDPVYDGSMFVLFAMPFDLSPFTESTDLVSDCGLAESMIDLLTLGVKLRVGFDKEMAGLSRAAQDEPRRSAETGPGSGVPVSQYGNFLYTRRMTQEIAKLRAQNPITYS